MTQVRRVRWQDADINVAMPEDVPDRYASFLSMTTARILIGIGIKRIDIELRVEPLGWTYDFDVLRERIIWPAIMEMVYG